MCEADYLRLTTHGSRYYDAAVAVLLVSVGYGVSVVAKLASSAWSDTSVHVEGWEYWAVAIGVFIALVLFVIDRLMPNPRRALLKQMKDHFQTHPRERKVVRRPDEQ